CQIVLMEIPRDGRRFLMTDTGVTIQPTLQQKRDFIDLAVSTAQRLGCDRPRVALMSATEKVNAALPDTVDSQQLVDAVPTDATYRLQGPLSFDLAYAADAGAKKGVRGEVSG